MKHLISILCLILASTTMQAQTGTTMTARGAFDVKVIPQPPDDTAGGPFGRLFLDKMFHGQLDGTSKGQMLAAGTAVEGSAGYVAMEIISGTLDGRKGSFILQHVGSMAKGVATMTVTIVPDSGTEQLTGIAGRMTIIVADGQHTYELEYTLGT
jgi:hypothetical protein